MFDGVLKWQRIRSLASWIKVGITSSEDECCTRRPADTVAGDMAASADVRPCMVFNLNGQDAMGGNMFRAKRIYLEPSAEDGERYLVDRIWPRGVSKEAAALDGWLKDLAPSDSLRKWFAHDIERWKDFKRLYLEELSNLGGGEIVETLCGKSRASTVTLLFAAKDVEHNNAVCLVEFLHKVCRAEADG